MDTPNEHIGYLIPIGQTLGIVGLCCASGESGTYVVHDNVFPYRQTCANCGRVIVEGQSPNWPILFEPTLEDYLEWSGYRVS
jgi:hypothetical protein